MTVQQRQLSDQMLAHIRDTTTPELRKDAVGTLTNMADKALLRGRIKASDTLTIAGACIAIVNDMLEEE